VRRKPACRSGTPNAYGTLNEKLKSEQEKVKAEQEKVKAEQEKVKTEQDKVRALLRQLDQERELRRLFMDAAALRGVPIPAASK
jgi:peptidoglycan hydrolase CwlO-like protein